MDDFADRIRALSGSKRALLSERLHRLENRDPAAVGIPRNGDGGGSHPERADLRLVAYVVAKDGVLPEGSELREHVERELPDHLVPSMFVAVDTLPRGPTGKIDRASLPDPDASRRTGDDEFVEPQNEDEVRLAEIWREVLDLDLLSVNDNFFEVGGHSLLAIRLLGRIRESFGVELPMDALFESPTVRGTIESIRTLRWATGGGADGEGDETDEAEESIEL